MKKRLILLSVILFSIVVFPVVISGSLEKVFVLKLSYDSGVIKQESVYVTPMYFSEKKDQPEGGYLAKLLSVDKEELYSVGFEFPLEVTDLPVQRLEKGEIDLYLPYNSNAERIEIFSPEGDKVLDIDVRGFIENVCGDGVCDKLESYESCSLDCGKAVFSFVKDFGVFIAGGVILIILLVYLIRKKH
ncbi:MAG: hypothetical protein ABIB47_04955 [Candidatus Woesearchaeota archaeon]